MSCPGVAGEGLWQGQLVSAVVVPDLLQDFEYQRTFMQDGSRKLSIFHSSCEKVVVTLLNTLLNPG